MVTSEIPKALIDQIKDGSVILFLGAGASRDSVHPQNIPPPSGGELASMIAEKFLGGKYQENNDLQYISELAISETDLFTVQKFIYDKFKDYLPGRHHLLIPRFFWHSIYTTNFDLIVEESYSSVKDKLQTLITFIKNGERVRDKMGRPEDLMFSKLHGSISDISDHSIPLILTTDQYISHRKHRSRLFSRLSEASHEFPILFVGYSLADFDIRYTLRELDAMDHARPRSYMVGPGITDAEQRMWDYKKISSIKLTFNEFIHSLDAQIPFAERAIRGKLRKPFDHPIKSKFQSGVQEPTERLINFLNNDLIYIHAKLPEKNTDPSTFYRGYFEGWDPIIKNYDVERNITDKILSEVFLIEEEDRLTRQELFLIKGNAGSGKTVLLHRLAWEASVTFGKLGLFYKSSNLLEYERISELYQLVKERIFLFIDNVTEKSEEVQYLLYRSQRDNIPISIISAERVNLWNIEGDRLNKYLTRYYEIKYLEDREIESLISLLEEHKSLGYLESKSDEERKLALSERAGRELLVALYEATAGKPFPDIVLDEYDKIPILEAKELYLTICMFHRIGAYTRAGNISRIHNISFSYFREKLFNPLESIVYFKRNYTINDFVFETRHQLIAELVFEQVLVDPNQRFSKYIETLRNLDVDYESDHIVFKYLTNARLLLNTFSDVDKIRGVYAVANEVNIDEPALFQQESIFEMRSDQGNLDRAESLLRKAHHLDPGNTFISHSKAEFLLKKAENTTQKLIKRKYLDDSRKICKEIIRNKKSKNIIHGFHTLLKINIRELVILLEESGQNVLIDKKIEEIEKLISTVSQTYPNESFILEAEATFNEILQDQPKALASLESAFLANKRSPYLATRLANYYASHDNLEKAGLILQESVELNPGNKDLNYRYSRILMRIEPVDYSLLRRYLRRSFSKNDKRYEAQFWYARTLYILGEPEYIEYFNSLKLVPMDFGVKKSPQGILVEHGQERLFSGSVTKLESSYGFVKQDASGEVIFFHRPNQLHNLRINSRVNFRKAFNFYGPVALLNY